MQTNITNDRWQQLLNELSWNSKSAEHSAVVALSMAKWNGIEKDDAIDTILEFPAASYLRDNRHLLYAIWEQVSSVIDGEMYSWFDCEPIFDTAA